MMSILSLKSLSKSFGTLVAVDEVSLEVNQGEILALIGPNGAGKTTLVSQIYGELKPDSGKVLLGGEDITQLSIAERVSKGIGRSFQISNLLMDFSVVENAMIAEIARQKSSFRFFEAAFSDEQLRKGAETILRRVGLNKRGDVLVSSLSHGERRLLELALAMAREPRLLLLDEPMAGAGPEESLKIADIISGLSDGVNGVGILLIEHDIDAVFRLADRVVVMVEGAVIASGAPDEISRNRKVRRAYLGDSA